MRGGAEQWWHQLTQEDPISLEALSELPVPPFELFPKSAGEEHGNLDVGSRTRHLFDPFVLAQYIVVSGRFENPYNREELSRDDCLRLDNHCKEHRQLGGLREARDPHAETAASSRPQQKENSVTEFYDLIHSMPLAKSDGSESHQNHALALRREASIALMHLFQFRRGSRGHRREREQDSSAHRVDRGSRADGADGEHGRGLRNFQLARRSSARGTTTQGEAGLVIIDDDDEEGDRWDRGGGASAATRGSATIDAEFPELSARACELAELRAAAHGDGERFLKIAEALAHKKAREDEERRQRRAVAARAREDHLRLHEEARMRQREEREREIAAREARVREEAAATKRVETARAEALHEEFELAAVVQAVEIAVQEQEAAAMREAERFRRLEEARAAKLAEVQRKEDEERAAYQTAEAKKQREAEKRRQKRERDKLKKAAQREVEAASAAAAAAKAAEEEAIRNAATKCHQCQVGVLAGKGFEVAQKLFCSTACVKVFRATGT